MQLHFPLLIAILNLALGSGQTWAHEFQPDLVEIFDARADVLDGDTSTLFVSLTVANGAPTTSLIGFETNRGRVGDWIEVRRVFGHEFVEVIDRRTIRTNTLYELQRPDAYLVIHDVDPRVYEADYGYLTLNAVFEDGARVRATVWIDPIYVQVGR